MSEPDPNPGCHRRKLCARCLRPQNACICRWAFPVLSAVEVLILQHPLEVANPKGSARLLHLSLPRSRLVSGESFEAGELQALLHAPWPAQQADNVAAPPRRQPVLLYPEFAGEAGVTGAAPVPLDEELLHAPARLRLVVLDATWRKSRKMLHLNPLLQTLPRLALQDVPASRYLIRKAHLPHQLSTLEATCHALAQLDGGAEKFAPLLRAFDGLVAQQARYFRPASG